MTDSDRIKLINDISVKYPHMRISNVLHRVRKAEKAEELRRPSADPRGVVAMIRRLTGRA